MPKVKTTKPTHNFKNIWRNYFNYSPKFATQGILHSVDRNANIALNKKVDSIVKPILKNEGFKVVHLGEDLSRFYMPVNKQKSKESLEIPYINKYYKQRCKEIQKDIEEYGEEDVWDTNITEIGIDTVTCIGKYKGVGDSSTLYYFVLVIGGHDEEDLENTTVAVEVITPLDKGEEFFLNEVKKAVSKLDIWKFTGKKISVNKCPKSVTGSADKIFAYKGKIITASSKQKAIQKIIAFPKISIKEKIDNAKKFNENELFKKVCDATKHPDEKIEIKGKGEYSSVYIIVRKGNIVNIDNVVGDLDWAGIRKNETEAKKLFNYWKQLAQKECDGKIKFRALVKEITKEKSVWKD